MFRAAIRSSSRIIQIPLLQPLLLAQHLGLMLAAGVSLLEALRVIREETRSSISSILTVEQRQKFEEMKEKRREHREKTFKE